MTKARRYFGLLLITVFGIFTIANSGEILDSYSRELLSGENVLFQTDEWESGGRCIPRFDFYEPAMNVSLFDSLGNRLAIMECDDGTDCIMVIASFAECVAYSVEEPDEDTPEQEVSCTNDLPVYEPMPEFNDDNPESAENVKECNDEFTLRIEREDGSIDEVKYRQTFVRDRPDPYDCV